MGFPGRGRNLSQGIELAFKFHQEGRFGEAERLYREVLRVRPKDFEALHMLGILKLQQEQAEDAVRLIGAALTVDRRSVAAHSNHGLALAALKRHEEALASYERALKIAPRNADALTNRADALCDLGRAVEALASYDQAVTINPRHVAALVNRGLVLRELGRTAEALASYDAAVAADPGDVEAWNNRGVALHDLGRQSEALASYERALVLSPDYVDALVNRGNALLALKRPAEAAASYARVLVLKPDLADAHNYRGHALADLGHFEEALASYDKAIAIQPKHSEARLNRARVLGKLDRHEEAIAEYDLLLASKPDLPNLLSDIAHCYATTCHWSGLPELVQELTIGAVAGTMAVDPFMFLGFETTPQQQLDCARNWLRLKKISAVKREWAPLELAGDRIRIAYLSADFHRHATAHLIAELFEVHDRERFEIIGVSYGPDDGSKIRSRLIKSFDRFFEVSTRGDEDVAQLLRDTKVHIAVDLKGHTTDARIGILARRAAPVQATYLGFPGTSGADFIDYVIADRIALPREEQAFYSEKIVHLPDSYQVNDSKRPIGSPPPSRGELGLPEQGFVFACFNNTWKITSGVFDIWMRLLSATENSVLWLYRSNALAAVNLRKEAQARGVDPERLIFAPHMDIPEHLARLTRADLFLDTLHYNAHTTASDALWAGVPVVTCLGPTFAGRVAASLLEAAGLPELVTHDLGGYERLAGELAAQPALLQPIKQKLQENRLTCALFDTDRFRRHIEAAYTTMWETHQRGEAPRGFTVEPT
jgi:predicted O-linked N-acetylglucosamine transferase (SPINDLY family)